MLFWLISHSVSHGFQVAFGLSVGPTEQSAHGFRTDRDLKSLSPPAHFIYCLSKRLPGRGGMWQQLSRIISHGVSYRFLGHPTRESSRRRHSPHTCNDSFKSGDVTGNCSKYRPPGFAARKHLFHMAIWRCISHQFHIKSVVEFHIPVSHRFF